ncbi:hypothetical protein [Streptomyces showdoensis]|uniref:Uncharacterized protein n=1 Tax=Streptomyces showdoensis TaxID=68268 RepID=A0A2P2GKN0_STREW|nr:hypothetical protein [Streptomyces showdoensis]KKZ72071.1 hypothetical protein VO63_20005 [Streptomyces showdoensis]
MPPKTRTTQSPAARARARQRPVLKMTICDDAAIKTTLDLARHTLRRAKADAANRPGDQVIAEAVTLAQQELDAAQAAFDTEAYDLRFQALPRGDFEGLKKLHPPTEAQAEEGYEVNVETFGPALVAAASLDELTVDDARSFLETWGEAEAAQLFNTAWNVQNETRADVGKG